MIILQFYSASFLGDMSEVVSLVCARYPKANVYAVGWSLGGNILVRYLGQVLQLILPILWFLVSIIFVFFRLHLLC